MSDVQAQGLKAVFGCLYPEANGYLWAINGTYTSQLPQNQLVVAEDVSITQSRSGSPDLLMVTARPEYNNTFVQCLAIIVVGGSRNVPSDNRTLLVQGMS